MMMMMSALTNKMDRRSEIKEGEEKRGCRRVS